MLIISFIHAFPSKTKTFYHRGTRFTVPCLYHPLPFVTGRHVTPVAFHLAMVLNLVATNIFSLPLKTADNFSVTNSSDVLIMNVRPFNYEIVSYVKLYSGPNSYIIRGRGRGCGVSSCHVSESRMATIQEA
jgi:hypothetical protein